MAKDKPNLNVTHIKIPGVTTILVVGPFCYGYGGTIKDAKLMAKANCAKRHRKTAKFLAFLGDDSLGVNDVGFVSAREVLIELGEV